MLHGHLLAVVFLCRLPCLPDLLIDVNVVLVDATKGEGARKLLQQVKFMDLLRMNPNNVLLQVLDRA